MGVVVVNLFNIPIGKAEVGKLCISHIRTG